jgi:flavin-dependent dehydrogenase
VRHVDVLVVGAGPAGATLALNLAPTRNVVLVERSPQTAPRIGESLPPAARRLLADMGLFASFAAQGHVPCHGNRALWESETPVETDFLRGPDGPGWHLDRARFDAWLRRAAIERGAKIIAPARVETIAHESKLWRVSLTTAAGPVSISANLLVDAGGRSAPIARRLHARRHAEDRLVCGWIHGCLHAPDPESGFTYVEAAENGWWYTAPLPGTRRVLAFHTDADLPGAAVARNANALFAHAMAHRALGALLSNCGFTPTKISGYTAAHSSVLKPCAGPHWLAAGDAALTFDPLSSQGIYNSLFTGLAAAEAADRHLSGAEDAMPSYVRAIERIGEVYRRDLLRWYRYENRWVNNVFWRRRHASARREEEFGRLMDLVGEEVPPKA